MQVTLLLLPLKTQHQQRVNTFMICILDIQMAMQQCQPIVKGSATYMVQNPCYDIATASYK